MVTADRAPAAREQLTPNQLDKQRQIIRAAMHVLATRGLAACTAREVAASGPLTKSAIHYYFTDMDLLIDRAMAEHVANFEASLRSAAAAAPDPAVSFWHIADAYLATFHGQPHVTYLWLEYFADAARKGRTSAIAQLNQRIITVLAEQLEAAQVRAPAEAAHAVFVFLLGAIQDQASNDAQTPEQIHQHIAALAGLALPRPGPGRTPPHSHPSHH